MEDRDPVEHRGHYRDPEPNSHDTAVLYSDDLGGSLAIITRGSATAAIAAGRRWDRISQVVFLLVELVLLGAVIVASYLIGTAAGSWILSTGTLPQLGGHRVEDAFVAGCGAVSTVLFLVLLGHWLLESGGPEVFDTAVDVVTPRTYNYGRPLSTATSRPTFTPTVPLLDRDVLGHASWETGDELTIDQRQRINSTDCASDPLAAAEGANTTRARVRRERAFASTPLARALQRPLSERDVITEASLDYEDTKRDIVETRLELHYAGGDATELHFIEEPTHMGATDGYFALMELANAQGIGIALRGKDTRPSAVLEVVEPWPGIARPELSR